MVLFGGGILVIASATLRCVLIVTVGALKTHMNGRSATVADHLLTGSRQRRAARRLVGRT